MDLFALLLIVFNWFCTFRTKLSVKCFVRDDVLLILHPFDHWPESWWGSGGAPSALCLAALLVKFRRLLQLAGDELNNRWGDASSTAMFPTPSKKSASSPPNTVAPVKAAETPVPKSEARRPSPRPFPVLALDDLHHDPNWSYLPASDKRSICMRSLTPQSAGERRHVMRHHL